MNKSTFTTLIVLLCIQSIVYSQQKHDVFIYETESNIIYDICYTNNGGALAIADYNAIKIYSEDTKELLAGFNGGHKKQILSIDISKDSTLLVSGGMDSTIVIWNLIENEILETLTYQQSIVTSVKISPSGKYLLSGGANKLYLYNIAEKKIIKEMAGHRDVITSVAFSPDEKIFASSSADKTINIYETESGNLITKLTAHRSWVRDLSFSQDGTKLISCGDDSRIIIWNISDITNIKLRNQAKYGNTWLLSTDFNEDNKAFALGDLKGNVFIITQFKTYKTKVGTPINKLLFKPNNEGYIKIAVATSGKGVFVIDANAMK